MDQTFASLRLFPSCRAKLRCAEKASHASFGGGRRCISLVSRPSLFLRHFHLQISCRIFLWDYDSKIVISGERLEVVPWHRMVDVPCLDHAPLPTPCCRCFTDIDGTITKSDVLGHAAALVGTDWTHTGVASLFSDVYRNGYRFLYLSSRSISQAVGTRGTTKMRAKVNVLVAAVAHIAWTRALKRARQAV